MNNKISRNANEHIEIKDNLLNQIGINRNISCENSDLMARDACFRRTTKRKFKITTFR